MLLTFVVPEEFQYDPVSKTYGDPTRRPEIKSSTIEFIAPSEYMVSCIILELWFSACIAYSGKFYLKSLKNL